MKTTLALLLSIPASDPFWRNEWQFTRDIVTNESRQGLDNEAFEEFLTTLPRKLRRVIDAKAAKIAAKG